MKKTSSFLLEKLIQYSGQNIMIPFYHAVSDEPMNFVSGLYPPRKIKDFEKDLDVLLEFYEPITLEKLIEIVNSGKEISKKYFHITFDDGLSNFYDVVAPILKKRNIPATVFVNTGFVNNNSLFYRYKVVLLLEVYKKLGTKEKMNFEKILKKYNTENLKIDAFLLNIDYYNKFILDELAQSIGYSFSNYLKLEKPYLSKSQLIELMDDGFTIGAHSVDHPFYYKISEAEQLNQTRDSIAYLQTELGVDYKVFSFPFADFGVNRSFFDQLKNELDISFGTSGIKRDVIQNNFQRISFEHAGKDAKQYLAKEYIKYFLKTPLKKSVMKRG